MEQQLNTLLTHVAELEGLLNLVRKQGSDVPQVIIDRIKAHAAQIDVLAQAIPVSPQSQPAAAAMAPAPAPEPAAAPAAQPEPEPAPEAPMAPPPAPSDLPNGDYDADDTWQHDHGEEFNEIFAVPDYVEPTHATAPAQKPAQEPAAPAAPAAPAPEAAAPAQQPSGLSVEQKLQSERTKDLRSALSINDRFRFRRELFSNSEGELNDALDLIETMQSFDEATDYFYGDLNWDRTNPEVIDFMEMVRYHFL